MTLQSRITEEARKLIDNGNCADCINDMHCDCFERYCDALTAIDTAAEQRGREMEREDCIKIAEAGGNIGRCIALSIRSREEG
ncbi:MAG: hypothetical protein ACTHJQ_22740 [Rhizobiaceae bacterium]